VIGSTVSHPQFLSWGGGDFISDLAFGFLQIEGINLTVGINVCAKAESKSFPSA
jgi:hypothetical protein